MLSLRMLSHGFKIITLDTFSWKYNKFTHQCVLGQVLWPSLSSRIWFNKILSCCHFWMLKYTFSWTYTTVQSPLWPCPCPLSLPQFWRSIPDRDTDPPLALSLTTLHTSYCKHCTRSYFHNFEHILLQNIAQDIFYNFAHMLLQNIV